MLLTIYAFENFYFSSGNLSSLSCDLGSLSLLSNRADSLVTNLQTCVKTLINETNVKYDVTTLCQFEILLFISKSHTKYVGNPQFAHHCY